MDFLQVNEKKPYLLCVDSDGCAMDTMECKHRLCFGPCMITEWSLDPWREDILRIWNDVNLYQITRGTNRFAALAQVLQQVNAQYCPIPGIDALTHWTKTAAALSNDSLRQAIENAADADERAILEKALHWSQATNRAIDALPEEQKHPFAGALEALQAAHELANVAVVSSANREAVQEEWSRCGLLPNTDLLLTQDVGSKAKCLALLRESGYSPDHILMVGDAPGDLQTAKSAGVAFFPILVRQEAQSWKNLRTNILPLWLEGDYPAVAAHYQAEFYQNLGVKSI